MAAHLESAPDSEEVLLWIYRISTNYCLNEIRNKKRRLQGVEWHEEFAHAAPETELFSRDFVRRILQRTPPHLRAATWLHCVDGLTHEEVGETLGVSRRTVINYIADFASSARKFADSQRVR